MPNFFGMQCVFLWLAWHRLRSPLISFPLSSAPWSSQLLSQVNRLVVDLEHTEKRAEYFEKQHAENMPRLTRGPPPPPAPYKPGYGCEPG